MQAEIEPIDKYRWIDSVHIGEREKERRGEFPMKLNRWDNKIKKKGRLREIGAACVRGKKEKRIEQRANIQ